jgi:NitT/TauT family transport system substrate-binding protein
MPIRPPARLRALAVGAAVLLLGVAGCGTQDGKASESAGTAGSAVSAQRCDQNKAAGKVTFLTGYYYQASTSILEALAAQKLGYFNDLCLDVDIQPGPGDTSQNAKLVASGKVQVTGLAEQDVIQSNLNGLGITGLSSYSDAGLDVLMTPPDVSDLTQLDGKTVGEKGWVPLAVQAMMEKAGVDWKSLKLVKVGYDPTILPRGQVDALTGFVSNEPMALEAAGHPVKVWQPAGFGVPSSLGSFAANPAFVKSHPTAVQDFLRAVFKAYQYCAQPGNVKRCIGFDGEYAGPQQFDPAHEAAVWTTEVKVAKDHPLPGKWGGVDLANVRKLAGLISQYGGQQVSAAQAVKDFEPSFADSVVDAKGRVVWPAP